MMTRFVCFLAFAATMCVPVLANNGSNDDKKIKKSGVSTKKIQADITPQQAFEVLKAGNARFVAGQVKNQRKYRKQVSFTAKGQHPHFAILSCLDSRVSVDDIFDLNNGDAFNARIAGNVVNEDILGSFEFATAASGADVIVVLGHTNCGAIKGACDGVKLGNLTGLLEKITPSVGEIARTWKTGDKNSKNHDFVEAVGEENIRRQMRLVTEKSSVIKDLVDKGKVMVVGGVYDLETGKVKFLS